MSACVAQHRTAVLTSMPVAIAISFGAIPASANIRQRRCSERRSVSAALCMAVRSSLSSSVRSSFEAGSVVSWLMVSDERGCRCAFLHKLMHSCLAILMASLSASRGEDKVPQAFQRLIIVSCAMSSAVSSSLKKPRPTALAFERRMCEKCSNSVCSIHLYNVRKCSMLCEVKNY